jgi:hypothetical protein
VRNAFSLHNTLSLHSDHKGIPVLGWGSLTYDWGGLSLREPVRWLLRGPILPIEFSRISSAGRRKGLLTAVVDEAHGQHVQTRLCVSALAAIAPIREELRIREGGTRKRWIGSIDRMGISEGDVSEAIRQNLHEWLLTTDYAGVVWTAIPPDFGATSFSLDGALEHLKALEPSTRQEARNYIVWAPDEVDTPLRRFLRKAGFLQGVDPRPIDVAPVWTSGSALEGPTK